MKTKVAQGSKIYDMDTIEYQGRIWPRATMASVA